MSGKITLTGWEMSQSLASALLSDDDTSSEDDNYMQRENMYDNDNQSVGSCSNDSAEYVGDNQLFCNGFNNDTEGMEDRCCDDRSEGGGRHRSQDFHMVTATTSSANMVP